RPAIGLGDKAGQRGAFGLVALLVIHAPPNRQPIISAGAVAVFGHCAYLRQPCLTALLYHRVIGLRDLENLNHPWGGVEGPSAPPPPPQGGGTGAGAARPRTPTLGCFEISESLRRSPLCRSAEEP